MSDVPMAMHIFQLFPFLGTVSSDDLSVIAIARVIALAADSLMLDQTADGESRNM